MNKKEMLLNRLNKLGETLRRRGDAWALLGLGSVGIETNRLDEYSDLDFFIIAKEGCKEGYLTNLDWLTDTYSLAYSFLNTKDGFKFMFEDGIYGECAIFEEWELDKICYSPGRIVWRAADFKNSDITAPKMEFPKIKCDSIDFAVNEALTNLYVGLSRYARGEKLSGTRLIQNHAVDRLMSILHLLEKPAGGSEDSFMNERRIEQRYPKFSVLLSKMVKGYDNAAESALSILEFIESFYKVNSKLKEEILELARKIIS